MVVVPLAVAAAKKTFLRKYLSNGNPINIQNESWKLAIIKTRLICERKSSKNVVHIILWLSRRLRSQMLFNLKLKQQPRSTKSNLHYMLTCFDDGFLSFRSIINPEIEFSISESNHSLQVKIVSCREYILRSIR